MPPLSILFVTSRLPHPLRTGDRVRAFHQLRLLSRRHKVTLVTYRDRSGTEAAASALEAYGIRVVTVPLNRLGAAWRVARCLWSDAPLQVALFDQPRMSATISELAAAGDFDLAHVQLARAVPLIQDDVSLPHVVDLVDALSLNMGRRAKHDHGVLGWAARIDAARLPAFEREVCLQATAATVVTANDRQAIGDYPSLEVNPNGVDLGTFPFVSGPRDRRRLIFTGNLGYFPNVQAILGFVRDVMPAVWREEPDVRLTIAGARPHSRVRALAADRRITIAGDVDHMHPYLAAAGIAVAPMLGGSGQLLKVLEAMASGTPVVATPLALSGIDAEPGVHALVGSTPAELAAHVVALVRDEARATDLARAGRSLVERLYTWERSVADLEAIYHRVAGGARPAAVGQ